MTGDDPLILALAVGATAAYAARKAGCSERTVRRKLARPEFRAKVDAARHALVTDTVGRLSGVSIKAVNALEDLLADRSAAIRLGAAKALLDFTFRGDERETLARQLRQLREEIDDAGHDAPRDEPVAAESSRPEDGSGTHADAAASRPGRDHDAGRAGAGPVAEDAVDDIEPLFG
jgi:hypothetical protein